MAESTSTDLMMLRVAGGIGNFRGKKAVANPESKSSHRPLRGHEQRQSILASAFSRGKIAAMRPSAEPDESKAATLRVDLACIGCATPD